MLNRREALQLLATGAVLQLAPGKLMATLREAHAVLGTQASRGTLNVQQRATVTTMAELILPKTDTPGATDVGACDFIDLILTEWYEEADRNRFLAGLADVDVRARALFGQDFVDCSLAQQADILTVLGEKMIEVTGRTRYEERPGRGVSQGTDKNFYSMLRRWTLVAYYTSEAGATAELNYEVIPDHYDGCAQAAAGKGETESQ